MSLENDAVQLHLIMDELRVHLFAVSEEVLRVPKVRLDGNLDVHVLQNVQTFLLRLAVSRFGRTNKAFASVNHEEKVRTIAIVIGCRWVLQFNVPFASVVGGVMVGAGVVRDVLREHEGYVHRIPDRIAGHAGEVVSINAVFALQPNSAEVLFLISCDSFGGTWTSAQLVGDKELVLFKIVDGP